MATEPRLVRNRKKSDSELRRRPGGLGGYMRARVCVYEESTYFPQLAHEQSAPQLPIYQRLV